MSGEKKRIHFMGIGGVGMAGLALLLKAEGHEVTGCDVKASGRTRWLESQGIAVSLGHSADHARHIDELVVTPAVRRDEDEFALCRARRRYRGEVLAELANSRETIAVCGSHGKTTTSTWIAKLLRLLGEDVAWCIGGETGDFPVAGVGPGPLVAEADESDGTLALYRARTLVVNKCEYDHPDHFKTEADYLACFEAAKAQALDVVESERLGGFETLPELKSLECLKILAPHNLVNARAAVEVALRRGHSPAAIARVLGDVVATLPDRRFQTIWPHSSAKSGNGFCVIADYAHHPTEMACAVQMARRICDGKLRVLFQPHRYSRTKALLEQFPAAFEGADEVVLCPTYAAFETPIEGGDVADLYAACRARFKDSASPRLFLATSCPGAWEHAFNCRQPNDVTLLLGAGDIIALVPKVIADLADGPKPRQMKRVWIGAGSNTWRSDLELNVEYVKTTYPAGRLGATLGIPWMAGIPGTIGGWVKMNAGAFGHSISEVIDAVCVDGEWMPAASCGFGYRTSAIKGEIRDVRLKPNSFAERPAAAHYLAKRHNFPAGTFGSFFRNPPNDFAGRLLEECGAKALSVGKARVWERHANVIVRGEGATASDVLALARLMKLRVWYRCGIALESEVAGIALD